MQTSPLTTGNRRAEAAASRTRLAILEATIDVIARNSLSGTTIQQVALAAGVATGTVILHFNRKEALLIAALEHVAAEFEAARKKAVEGAEGDPLRALEALIDMNFDPAVASPMRVAVWYAFWGEAQARQTYLERTDGLDRAYQAGIERLFVEMAAREKDSSPDPRALAIGFIGLLEWFWQDIMIEGASFDRRRAVATARAYLKSVFPSARTEPFNPTEIVS